MKIKFNSDNELPLNKTIEIHNMIIVVSTVFDENNKYYPQVLLDGCLYKLNNIKMLCCGRIDVSEIKQVHQESVTFSLLVFFK